jgi:hypothetical protein
VPARVQGYPTGKQLNDIIYVIFVDLYSIVISYICGEKFLLLISRQIKPLI